MADSGIHDQLLEVTVIACNKLKKTEWITRQDPFVYVEYGNTKYRTRTYTDGGKNPTFHEKFSFTLIEGVRELNLAVWNSNTVLSNYFIGSGKVQLKRVISQGYDDIPCQLRTTSGSYAGEVQLILHYANANKPATSRPPSAPPPCGAPPAPPYRAPPLPAHYPPPYPGYQPYGYGPPPPCATYPPPPYPPSSSFYPLPPQPSTYHPQGQYHGMCPPPPY